MNVRGNLVKVMLLAGLAAPFCAAAQNPEVWGWATNSCGQWTEVRQTDNAMGAHQWVLGYVTAYNVFNQKKQAKLRDAASTYAYIDRYCRNNPRHSVLLAAFALVDERGGAKATHAWQR